MTKPQLNKLNTILTKLETLQHMGIASRADADDLQSAKSALMRVLRRNDI